MDFPIAAGAGVFELANGPNSWLGKCWFEYRQTGRFLDVFSGRPFTAPLKLKNPPAVQ